MGKNYEAVLCEILDDFKRRGIVPRFINPEKNQLLRIKADSVNNEKSFDEYKSNSSFGRYSNKCRQDIKW